MSQHSGQWIDSGATTSCTSCTSEVANLGATEFGATESVVESCELSKQGPEATLPLAQTEGPMTLEPAGNLRRGGQHVAEGGRSQSALSLPVGSTSRGLVKRTNDWNSGTIAARDRDGCAEVATREAAT